jgi:hypothetical protein
MDASPRVRRFASHAWRVIGVALMATGCGQTTSPPPGTAAAEGTYKLEGTLNASGSRHTIPVGDGRYASTLDLTGSLLLEGPARPGVGFQGEAVGLTDTLTGFQGRSVWTDENGDQLFSEVKGQGTAKGESVSGKFVGGTGRYGGATGHYEFEWEYVLESEDGTVQGRGIGLTGRLRIEPESPTTAPRKERP